MNKNSLRIILSFSIVIQVICMVLLYMLIPSDTGFIPTCLAMVFATLVFIFSLLSYQKQAKEEGHVVNARLGVLIYLSIIITIIIIRLILLLF